MSRPNSITSTGSQPRLADNLNQEPPPRNNQKSATDDDTSWNIVATKRPNSSAPSAIKSKHPSQKPKSNAAHKNNNKPKGQQGENNNRKPKNKNSTNENAKKKSKPKPKNRTVGDMISTPKGDSNNKKQHKQNKHQQQQQQPRVQVKEEHQNFDTNRVEDFPALGGAGGNKAPRVKHEYPPKKINESLNQKQLNQLPRQEKQHYPGIHMDSVKDFPSLGASNISTASTQQIQRVSAPPKKGWGIVPKPPPPQSSDLFRAESKGNSRGNLREPIPKHHKTPSIGTKHQPMRVLKRGETAQQKSSANVKTIPSKMKKIKSNKNVAPKVEQQAISSSAASFFQPRPRSLEVMSDFPGQPGRDLQGEEHQLLRLVQERNVYQKKGRQRVAPRKKRFTALKKKVLQERLDQWRALHPEDSPSEDQNSNISGNKNHSSSSMVNSGEQGMPRTRSLCLYNYAELDELEDDDEYEEILENLTSMATKIGPIEEIYLSRKSVQARAEDILQANIGSIATKKEESCSGRPYRHPAFILFQKDSDASAALACWSNLVIGGRKLEVFGLRIQDEMIDKKDSQWCDQVLVAELVKRNEEGTVAATRSSESIEILLQKVLTEEDYEDKDCMNESIEDLKKIAVRFGAVKTIRSAGENGDVIIIYENTSLEDAQRIASDLCRVVIGGQPLYASIHGPANENWKTPKGSLGASSTILLENVLTDDDLQDSDCLQESLADIKELCLRYGTVSNVVAKGFAVKVSYEENENNTTAETAADELNGIVLGGNTVRASVLPASDSEDNHLERSIDLHNLLTKEDLEDNDCMEESLDDVRKLALNFGKVASVSPFKTDDSIAKEPTNAYVRIEFEGNDPSIVAKAIAGFNGMVIGGQIISACLSISAILEQETSKTNPGEKRKPIETPQHTNISETSKNTKKARTDDKAPLYSGDKLISERFAAMKRVPKIPNKQGPRDYASGASTDERIKPLLTEMLGELMRLQKRAIEDKNAKARRRMVMGLREVARGIRAHKGMFRKIKKKYFKKTAQKDFKFVLSFRSYIFFCDLMRAHSQDGYHGQQPGSVRGD